MKLFNRKKKKDAPRKDFRASLYCHDDETWSVQIQHKERGWYTSFESWATDNDVFKPWPKIFQRNFPSQKAAETEACKMLDAVLEFIPRKRPARIEIYPGDCT